MYKHLFETDEDEAYKSHEKMQKDYDRSAKQIMYFAYIGGIVVIAITGGYYGENIGVLVMFVGLIWYLLGFWYCKMLWDKEKDWREFMEAFRDFSPSDISQENEEEATS